MINTQQRDAYCQALATWKNAARDSNTIRNRVMNANANRNEMYVLTTQDLQVLQKEYDAFARLLGLANQL